MDDIYKSIPLEKIPWNMETPPEILLNFVKKQLKKSSIIIELGCGAGNYVIHLAKEGYDVTGVDISQNAIEIAIHSAKDKAVQCQFFNANVLEDLSQISEKYDLVYDWELLHHIFPEDREKYYKNIKRVLKTGGLYFSVFFSEESPQFGGKGKYRKTPLDTVLYFSSESEIKKLAESFFKIVELKSIEIQGKYAPHKAIYTILKNET